MKKIILIAIVASIVFSCSDNKKSYNINGTWVGAEDGEKVYIQYKDTQTEEIVKYDSAEVKDGVFKFSGELTNIGIYDLSTKYGKKDFVLSDNDNKVDIDITEIKTKLKTIKRANFKFSIDIEQEHYKAYDAAKMTGMVGVMAVAFILPKAQAEGDKILEDSILNIYVSSMASQEIMVDSLVTNFKDSYLTAILLKNEYSKKDSFEDLLNKYNSLTDRIKNSVIGKELKVVITEIGKLAVGQLAPDFSAMSPSGENISLSSLKGKYVLIDFWASWCAPCLKEAPNLIAVYNDYKSKGFEILSVSLDKDSDRNKWVNAIEKHELDWKHISTLDGWACKIAKLYNVSAVPSMILIDKEGRIISKDLRGDNLRIQVAKMIDNK